MALSRFVLPYADVGSGIKPSSGAKLYFYATDTSTPSTTYSDSTADTPSAHPVVADANGVFPAIFLSGIFNVVLDDANDVQIWTADPVSFGVLVPTFATVTAMTAATPLAVDGSPVAFTVGMFVTIVDYATGNNSGVMFGSIVAGGTGTADGGTYIDLANGTQWKQNFSLNGKNVKHYGANIGAADNASYFHAAIASMSSGGTIYIPDGTFNLTPLTTAVNNLRLEGPGILNFPTLGASVSAITNTGNNFEVDGLTFVGPSGGAYVLDEMAIDSRAGTITTRKNGLKFMNCEFYGFGAYCINASFTDQIVIEDSYFHDTGGAGCSFRSCNDGLFINNRIINIALDGSSNAYGISMTHTSSGWPSDAANKPFCRNWRVSKNFIENIDWEGIDAHGGWGITVTDNQIFNTQKGIGIASSSGDATNYAGGNNKVINNLVDARKSDGSTGDYEYADYGINVNGGTASFNDNVQVIGNTVLNHGILANDGVGAIQGWWNTGLIIADNVIESFAGSAIHVSKASDAIISNNTITSMNASETTVGVALMCNHVDASDIQYLGNKVLQAREGIRHLSVTAPIIANNKFVTSLRDLNVTPYVNKHIFYDTSISGTIDINSMGNDFILVVRPTADYTLTNLINGNAGVKVTIVNQSAYTVTFDRSNSALDGGANWAGANQDSLTLVSLELDTGVDWYEVSRSANS